MIPDPFGKAGRWLPGVGLGLVLLLAQPARADEGGVSFWLPGQYGSLAAAPVSPGWSLGSVYYHASTEADGEREFAIGGRIVAGLDADADLLFLAPTFAFEDEVWGGQLALAMTAVYGRANVVVEATLTEPGGAPVSRHVEDSETGIGDLYPSATLRWANGVHNTMAYVMGGVPVGDYGVDRLANLGTNHWSLDAGGGYTYFNPENGRELSAVLGFTYNFENPDTDYQNGISGHLDWAASQFLSETTHVGLVGYLYNQLSGDSGAGATLGDFESRVAGIGPQVGVLFNEGAWYFNAKGIYEFNARHRPEGWNLWLTLSMPLGKRG